MNDIPETFMGLDRIVIFSPQRGRSAKVRTIPASEWSRFKARKCWFSYHVEGGMDGYHLYCFMRFGS